MKAERGAKKRAGSGTAMALAALVWAGSGLHAQTPAAPPPGDPNKPAEQQKQAPAKPADANPFPEDTNSVPVLPSGDTPAVPEAPSEANPGAAPALPPGDVDPVRSPDEPMAQPGSSSGESSSSNADLANILTPPPDEPTRTTRKGKNQPPPEHKETAQEDESVGRYYLDQKNWRAALSRFQSALVLDPENPDVYWGLAEAQRHLGDLANAKANYMKVMEYDPDSKHAKEAKKLLNDPEMAKAPSGAGPR